MKKLLILFFLTLSLIASDIKELKSLDEIQEGKNTFIIFSTTYCPWCARQKRVLEDIDVIRDDLQSFYVNDTSKIYKELLSEYAFVVEFFPTSYIVIKEEGKLEILYEFEGFQKQSNIIQVLDDVASF